MHIFYRSTAQYFSLPLLIEQIPYKVAKGIEVPPEVILESTTIIQNIFHKPKKAPDFKSGAFLTKVYKIINKNTQHVLIEKQFFKRLSAA